MRRGATDYPRPVIVVVGDPVLAISADGDTSATGQATAIARGCVQAGATVQLAGKLGDDPAGDEVLLALTRDGIGHAAVLRDPAAATVTVEAPRAEPDVDTDAPLARDDDDPAGDGSADVRTAPMPAGSTLGPEDLDLALRYLTSFSVLVVAGPVAASTLAVAVESAAYAGAHLALIDVAGDVSAVPGEALTVLGSPDSDPEGDFAALVGRYAAALDAGRPADAAFRTALGPVAPGSPLA